MNITPRRIAFLEYLQTWPHASDECILWDGYIRKDGYGQITWEGKSRPLHQVAYILTKGEIPVGLDVMHSCNNKPCYNPNHLSAGTRSQTVKDAIRDGLLLRPKKLSPREIQRIKERRAEGVFYKDLAKEFGVGYTTAYDAVNDRRNYQREQPID